MIETETAYAKVIDILTKDDMDYKRFVIELAKKDPIMFLQVYNGTYINEDLKKIVLEYWKAGNKIAAIKHYREVTGYGTKDALDACEKIAADAGMSGI